MLCLGKLNKALVFMHEKKRAEEDEKQKKDHLYGTIKKETFVSIMTRL